MSINFDFNIIKKFKILIYPQLTILINKTKSCAKPIGQESIL